MKVPLVKAVFLGAGNLAFGMAQTLHTHNVEVLQIYSRTEDSAKYLADFIGCSHTHTLSDIRRDADIYIVAIPDHGLATFAGSLSFPGKLLVHTSAATPIDILSHASSRYGILYPLQTFTKGHVPDLSEVPFLVEAASPEDTLLLKQIARLISPHVHEAGLETRRRIHLAAAFVCNFTNYLYTVGEDILKEDNLPFHLLCPLMQETLAKVTTNSPKNVQTGPAIRGDVKTLTAHLKLLEKHPNWKIIYKLISEQINPELSL